MVRSAGHLQPRPATEHAEGLFRALRECKTSMLRRMFLWVVT